MRVRHLVAGPALVVAALLAASLLAQAPIGGQSGGATEVAQQDGHSSPQLIVR